MALRIGPPPALARLRLHWNTTRNEWVRQQRAWQVAQERQLTLIRTWWQSTTARLPLSATRRRERLLARQQAQAAAFTTAYEELVDVLCWAAQAGADAESTANYLRLRALLLTQYPRLRPHLCAFLALSGSDGTAQPLDAFQSLFVPDTLEQVIHAGDAIEHMMIAQSALECYQHQITDPSAQH